MKRKNIIIFLLFLLGGIVIGSLVAEVSAGISWLSWLAYGLDFGIGGDTPILINLHVIKLYLGLSLSLNIAVILFVCAAMFAYRQFTKGA